MDCSRYLGTEWETRNGMGDWEWNGRLGLDWETGNGMGDLDWNGRLRMEWETGNETNTGQRSIEVASQLALA